MSKHKALRIQLVLYPLIANNTITNKKHKNIMPSTIAIVLSNLARLSISTFFFFLRFVVDVVVDIDGFDNDGLDADGEDTDSSTVSLCFVSEIFR